MSRSSWIRTPKRLLVLSLLGACVIVVADDPAAIAGHHSLVVPGDAPAYLADELDPLVVALEGTVCAYRCGDLDVARSWFAFAAVLLEDAAPPAHSSRRWRTSNAAQLLVLLRMYDWYARGRNLELDAQHDVLVAWLYDIEVLNRSVAKPDQVGSLDVRYDLFSHLVREIGDLRVDYDLFTWQISQVGPYRVDYDLFTRMPRRIGNIEIHYDLIDRYPDTIADVRIR